jgi:outer membrane protein assembly factor BamB
LVFLSFFLPTRFYRPDRLVLVSASYGKNILAITEANGDVIWSYKTAGQAKGHAGHHDVHILPNGNILFHETWQDVKGNHPW